MSNGTEPSADPWDLADGQTLSQLLDVDLGSTNAPCIWRRGKLLQDDVDRVEAAAWLVAEKGMQLRFGPAADKFDIWRSAVTAGTPLSADERVAQEAFIEPSFGLPVAPGSDEHLQGHVAELIWFMLTQENDEVERELRNIEVPGVHVTAPGGDGLAVYERDAGFHFRLWEIKKHTANAGITGTVRRAYRQLESEGVRYLAQFTGTGSRYTGGLRALYAQLVEIWTAGGPEAGAGVSVSTSESRVPATCFSTMQNYFPALTDAGQLEGLVSGPGEFAAFAQRVRELVWSAL